MGACYCSLAGTSACKNCPNNYSNNIDFYHKWLPNYANYVYDYPTKEQLDSITKKENEWEIPSFMLKEINYDS